MSPRLRITFWREVDLAKQASKLGESQVAWHHLERAHILSQAYVYPHVLVHWKMLLLALRTRSWSEVWGQIPRMILAGPGSLFGRAPLGNTGRSSIGLFQPMVIPEDLAKILRPESSEGS